LIAAFPDGPFDLLSHYARPLPVAIIAHLLGVPQSASDDLLLWSNAMVRMYQSNRSRAEEDAAVAASVEFVAFLSEVIARKRASPSDDLLSDLISARDDGDRLSEDELVSTVILLLNAGHEATVHTIGNGVRTILDHGARGKAADPKQADAIVEEVLRFDPPLHIFQRYAYEEVTISGHTFQRGDVVSCLLGAANRDPEVYDRPNDFWPGRPGPTNVSFGVGLHFCVGAPLARLELSIAFQKLFATLPKLQITQTPQYADIYHFHGLENLMVRRS